MKRLALTVAVLALLAPRLGHANPGAELAVTAHPDHIEIIVPGAQAAAAGASASFDFVEVPVTGSFAAGNYVDASDDPTLKRVQLRPGAAAMLRVQLHHSQKTCERIAAATRLVAATDGLHVLVPRKEALASWAPAAPSVAKPNLIVEGPAAPAPPAPAAVPLAAAAAPGAALPAPVPVPAPAPAPALAVRGGSPAGPPTSSVALVIGILAAGGGLVLWARRRRPAPEPEAIRVIASRALGGKARVVLLAAGERELLLSVSDRGAARLIGRWRRGDTRATSADADADDAPGLADDAATTDEDRPGPSRQAPRGASPSVAGILKLKLRQQDAAAGLEPDGEWARALGGMRGEEHDA